MKNASTTHLIITGIPGTGKTTIGQYLEDEHCYKHINLEDPNVIQIFLQNPKLFIDNLLNEKKAVITWGFLPYHQAEYVRDIKKSGFKLIWFDGNRIAAFREFMKRGTVQEQMFYLQMWNITSSKVIEFIEPFQVNPFSSDNSFKEKHVIVNEIMTVGSK